VGPARTSLDKHRRGAQPVAVGGKTNYLERCTDFRGCERAAVGDGGQKPISFDVGVRAAIARANHPFVEEQAHRVLVGISSSSQLATSYHAREGRGPSATQVSVSSPASPYLSAKARRLVGRSRSWSGSKPRTLLTSCPLDPYSAFRTSIAGLTPQRRARAFSAWMIIPRDSRHWSCF
jgi:hypothetical protein